MFTPPNSAHHIKEERIMKKDCEHKFNKKGICKKCGMSSTYYAWMKAGFKSEDGYVI